MGDDYGHIRVFRETLKEMRKDMVDREHRGNSYTPMSWPEYIQELAQDAGVMG